MTVWVVRGGRYGEREAEALDRSVLTIGFGLLGYLSDVAGREGFTDVLRELHGGLLHQIGNYSCQVRSFVEGIQADDLVVMPRKGTGLLAMGVFAGGIPVPVRQRGLRPRAAGAVAQHRGFP